MYEDKTIKCVDCGNDFVFTAGEQEWYAEKGLTNEPKRCPDCRRAKKAQRENREIHIAVCAQCGGEARVKFEPREDKPVYCDACYKAMKQSVAE
jgi:CxxC-x17-CxxC domain-containing protein